MEAIMRIGLYVFILILIYGLTSCQTTDLEYSSGEISGYSYSVPLQLDDGWETGAPEPERLSLVTLGEGVRAIMRGEYPNIHSILIAHQGRLVFEEYFPGYSLGGKRKDFDQSTVHSLQSLTKSITALVVGVAVDQGYIEDINSSILSWYPEYDRRDRAAKKAITLQHLLTMQSGLEWNEWDRSRRSRFNDLNRHYRSRNPFDYLLKKRLVDEPGTRFSYNTATTNLIGDIVYRSTGYSFDEYAEQQLFKPLGIDNVSWEEVHPDIVCAGGCLRLTSRDVLKIGQLVLQNGKWQDRQIISEKWLEQALSPSVPFNEDADYGFLWWLLKETHPGTKNFLRPYVAGGTGGQYLFVYPQQDLVVVATGGNYFSERDTCIDWLHDYFLPAMSIEMLLKTSWRVWIDHDWQRRYRNWIPHSNVY